MKSSAGLGAALSPDTINRLHRAAQHRYDSAFVLWRGQRKLAALYLFGYVVEQCLAAAYFRSVGRPANAAIDRDARNRRLFQARQLGLMGPEPHPLVGWARFLQHQRLLAGPLPSGDRERLAAAIQRSETVYRFWRPELRYKIVDVPDEIVSEIQAAAKWFPDNRDRL